MGILIRWAVAAIGLLVAAAIVPDITNDGDFTQLLVVAAVLGGVNAIIRPLLKLLALPLIPLTLGLILLVINVFCFWLASWISDRWFDSGFHVDGIVAAIEGAIIVSVVSMIANHVLKEE